MNQSEELTREDYNNIPVHYCSKCLSLKIRSLMETDYCEECGSTDIDTIHIDVWNRMYLEKYGRKFIKDTKNGRKIEIGATKYF